MNIQASGKNLMNRFVGFNRNPIIENIVTNREFRDSLFMSRFTPENVRVHDFRNDSRNTNHIRCNNTCHDLCISNRRSTTKTRIEAHLDEFEAEGLCFIQCHKSCSIFPTKKCDGTCDETCSNQSPFGRNFLCIHESPSVSSGNPNKCENTEHGSRQTRNTPEAK